METLTCADEALAGTIPGGTRGAVRGVRPPVRRTFVQLPRRLFTATLSQDWGEFGIMIFHACHAADGDEVAEALAGRVSREYIGDVSIRDGIDVDDEAVVRLVPGIMRKRLADIGDCCPALRPLQGGGVLHVFQRIGG